MVWREGQKQKTKKEKKNLKGKTVNAKRSYTVGGGAADKGQKWILKKLKKDKSYEPTRRCGREETHVPRHLHRRCKQTASADKRATDMIQRLIPSVLQSCMKSFPVRKISANKRFARAFLNTLQQRTLAVISTSTTEEAENTECIARLKIKKITGMEWPRFFLYLQGLWH